MILHDRQKRTCKYDKRVLPIVVSTFALSVCSLGTMSAQPLTATVYRSAESVKALQSDVASRSGLAHYVVVGNLVTVAGYIGPGEYSPEIVRSQIRLGDHSRLPSPKRASFVELSSGHDDAQNVLSLLIPARRWTQKHLLYLIVILGILSACFLVLLMHIQLKRWKVKWTQHERERLARDIHDTLAQSFAGVGFQLQVIRRAITNGDSNLLRHLDTARDLVQFSHREARKSLVPSASDELGSADLLSSLRETAQTLVKHGLIQIEALSTGSVRALPREVNTQLIRIGQEAIANAIRHADPTHLLIAVTYEATAVRLKVVDDGAGFIARGDLLGFGIRGMVKRASEINADFDIESIPGIGTTIVVSAPIQRPKKFRFLFQVPKLIW